MLALESDTVIVADSPRWIRVGAAEMLAVVELTGGVGLGVDAGVGFGVGVGVGPPDLAP